MADLRVLATRRADTQGRIVAMLEDALAEAKAGKVTGLFMFAESDEGMVSHSRDGMSDSLVVFWIELIKRRILEGYQ